MHSNDLSYELPQQLIAQHPAARRGGSRLLVTHTGAPGADQLGVFEELMLAQLRPDDLVVANDSRVLHARLHVTRPTGGAAELLLLEPAADGSPAPDRSRWLALAKPARRLQPDMLLDCGVGGAVRCIERAPDGGWIVELPVAEAQVPGWLRAHGELPLPPYIAANGHEPERYQTIYARCEGSVAAPTAGLHFDQQLWGQVRERCETTTLTLHVGAGTFLPVREGTLDEHVMHAERYEVAPEADRAITAALAAGRRIVAVGTTATRVLESVYGGLGAPTSGSTQLFITPGYRFGCVGALLTNFHLPRSTLLALVMAFAGESTARACYATAISEQLRFFSFGDAMFVHGEPVASRAGGRA